MDPSAERGDRTATYLLAYTSEHPITGFSAAARLPWRMIAPATLDEVDELDRAVTADLRERGVISRSHKASVIAWSPLGRP